MLIKRMNVTVVRAAWPAALTATRFTFQPPAYFSNPLQSLWTPQSAANSAEYLEKRLHDRPMVQIEGDVEYYSNIFVSWSTSRNGESMVPYIPVLWRTKIWRTLHIMWLASFRIVLLLASLRNSSFKGLMPRSWNLWFVAEILFLVSILSFLTVVAPYILYLTCKSKSHLQRNGSTVCLYLSEGICLTYTTILLQGLKIAIGFRSSCIHLSDVTILVSRLFLKILLI